MGSFVCARRGCSASICLSPELEARLRRTHESFVCPFGHSQWFPEKTDEEKRIEELQRQLRSAYRVRDGWADRYYEALRIFAACPFTDCKWRSHAAPERVHRSLRRHFEKEHGERLRLVKASA